MTACMRYAKIFCVYKTRLYKYANMFLERTLVILFKQLPVFTLILRFCRFVLLLNTSDSNVIPS